ncbi:DUF6407 family protein [Bacillus weihaiensis]|uniref:Uncharacterized protein n=1 Tax=Bacillus weihaiensis TaxID=1547283 RepID=A0A1L3MV12_9BACI|nr:DUF6407 family protein [Bacillus weihaiensis]APH06178.1 hypothetical protein A9C19_16300 [Bacillus weihaiensis]
MTFEEFVRMTIESLDTFNPKSMKDQKIILKEAIHQYKLKSNVTLEAGKEVLYLYSMAEENMLNRISELASSSFEVGNVEELFEGAVVRRY